jgi:hypothetical protein
MSQCDEPVQGIFVGANPNVVNLTLPNKIARIQLAHTQSQADNSEMKFTRLDGDQRHSAVYGNLCCASVQLRENKCLFAHVYHFGSLARSRFLAFYEKYELLWTVHQPDSHYVRDCQSDRILTSIGRNVSEHAFGRDFVTETQLFRASSLAWVPPKATCFGFGNQTSIWFLGQNNILYHNKVSVRVNLPIVLGSISMFAVSPHQVILIYQQPDAIILVHENGEMRDISQAIQEDFIEAIARAGCSDLVFAHGFPIVCAGKKPCSLIATQSFHFGKAANIASGLTQVVACVCVPDLEQAAEQKRKKLKAWFDIEFAGRRKEFPENDEHLQRLRHNTRSLQWTAEDYAAVERLRASM